MNTDKGLGRMLIDTETRILRDAVGKFVREVIRPAEIALGPDASEFPDDVLQSLREKSRAAGYWYMDTPTEYGGGGLSTFQSAVIAEVACAHRFNFPMAGGGVFGWSPPVALYSGTDEQKERLLKPTISNGWATFTAVAEVTGGSDPARSIRTTAKRTDKGWLLNGTKMWISQVGRGKLGTLYARTESGVSAFILEMDAPGISFTKLSTIRDSPTFELRLQDCLLPLGNLIGEEGKGFNLAQKWLMRARLLIGARCVGIAEEALRTAVGWAKDREMFGKRLSGFQATEFAVADSRMEINAARLLVWQAALESDEGGDAWQSVAMAKLYAAEVAWKVLDRSMQMLGAMGLSRELPLESWMRTVRVARVIEGSSEVLRSMLGRAELK